MNKITFHNVVPAVFQGLQLQSDIWHAEPVFERGKLYLVEAESGKGKSTFCSYILGYRHDYTGQVLFNDDVLFDEGQQAGVNGDVDIKTYKTSQWTELRRSHISHLFQELRLFPELTAMENVLIKNQLTDHLTISQIESWFDRLGIPEKKDQKIGLMSFGQQQRVAMMRALAQPFDVILADEPISHLDDRNSQIMADIMMEEAHRQNACVIVTSIGKHMNLNYDKVYKL